MLSFPFILTANTILFFVSLLGAYYFENQSWIFFLYPLAFSLGNYLLVIFSKLTLRGKLGKNPISSLFIAVTGIIFYFLLRKFLPPISPPPPDPFVPDPPQPVDWHTIAAIAFPLSFWVYSFFQGVNYYVKILKTEKANLSQNLLTILTIMLCLYGFNIIIPMKETLFILLIDLVIVFSAFWMSYLIQKKQESGKIVKH